MAQNDLITHFPFGVSSRGMPVIGGGGRETTGNVFFVSSTASGRSDNINTHGTNPVTPFATLDYAIGACTANNGDIIYVMPGHAETIIAAGGIDADVAGITIVGLGNGANRPVFTFATSTSADMDVDAANISIENVKFDFTGIDGIIAGIDVNAADFELRYCEIITATTGNQAALGLLTDSNAHRLYVHHCRFIGASASGTNSAITINASANDIRIENNIFVGSYASGCIAFSSATYTNLLILRNSIVTLGTAQAAISVSGTATGIVGYNGMTGTDINSLLSNSTGAANVENYGYDSDSSSQVGVLVPLVGSSLPSSTSILDQIIGAEMLYNRVNYIAVTADFTSATWNTVASHEILTVTGAARIRILPICTSSITSGGAITLTLGTETTANAMIASTDATTIDANMAWLSTTPSHYYAKTAVIDAIIAAGQDIGYTVGTTAATGGTIVFHCWWEPLDNNSPTAVVAGAGGAL